MKDIRKPNHKVMFGMLDTKPLFMKESIIIIYNKIVAFANPLFCTWAHICIPSEISAIMYKGPFLSNKYLYRTVYEAYLSVLCAERDRLNQNFVKIHKRH